MTKPLRRLIQTIDAIGAGALGARTDRFGSAELSHLAEAINCMSQSLAEVEAQRKLALLKARRIQQRLLSEAGKVAGVSLAARHRPAEEVGGDYYDFLAAADGAWLLCVADVVGHGVPAAMTAAMLKILLLESADRATLPGEMLCWLNWRFMAVSLSEDFASLFLAKFDPAARRLWYASAGHEPGLFASGCSPPMRLGPTGPLVGILEEASWDTASLTVQPGDLLLALTDGVTEAMNPAGVALELRAQPGTASPDGRKLPFGTGLELDAEVPVPCRGPTAGRVCRKVALGEEQCDESAPPRLPSAADLKKRPSGPRKHSALLRNLRKPGFVLGSSSTRRVKLCREPNPQARVPHARIVEELWVDYF